MTTALFIGRFQPLHIGHMKDIKDILKECDKVIIAIGSAQYSITPQNPFTHSQRKEMIRLALNDAGIPENKYYIVGITDIHNDELWVGHVKSSCPDFDIAYTGNPLVKKLFERSGYKVKDITITKDISSSMIRERILHDLEWKRFVPNAAAYYLDDIEATALIKNIEKDIQSRNPAKK
ncbi:MAG: nicotinamide-nucleotide adenylyltransferase [archaeon]